MPWRPIGGGCIYPHFLDLSTSCRWVVSFMSGPHYSRGKSSQYPLDRRLGGPQSRSGICGEEKNSWPYQALNSEPLVVQPVASCYTDTLSQLPDYVYQTEKNYGQRSHKLFLRASRFIDPWLNLNQMLWPSPRHLAQGRILWDDLNNGQWKIHDRSVETGSIWMRIQIAGNLLRTQ
jgi:hypothetical protein